tara:strand:+ start:1898 stop:2362 length:465 start_codon:yes stop_codon:yes gene_type:complete
MSHYLVISDEGDAFLVEPTNDSYNDVRSMVEGLIERVSLQVPTRIDCWVNESGLLRDDLAVNWLASQIVTEATQAQYLLKGTAVFTGVGYHEEDGQFMTTLESDTIEDLASGYLIGEGDDAVNSLLKQVGYGITVKECCDRILSRRETSRGEMV